MLNKESISLSISNIIFHMMSEDFESLSAYLEVAEKYYHSLPNGQKQFEEFQFEIGEFLLEKLKDGGQYVVQSHIEEIKERYGVFKDMPYQNMSEDSLKNGLKVNQVTSVFHDHHNTQRMVMTVLSILGLSF